MASATDSSRVNFQVSVGALADNAEVLGLRPCESGNQKQAEKDDVKNERRSFRRILIFRIASLRFAARADDFGDDGLIEAAFGKKFRTEAIHFLQEDFAGIVDEADAAKIDAKFGAWGGGGKLTPALLQGSHAGSRE